VRHPLHALRADPRWRGGDYHSAAPGEGPHVGLGLARRIAHVQLPQRGGDAEPASAASRRARRTRCATAGSPSRATWTTTPTSWPAGSTPGPTSPLTEAMNGHDVGRGRGGVTAALSRVTARTVVVAIDSDRLYPPSQQEEIAAAVPGAELHTVSSLYGHDGFLLETDALGPLLRRSWDPGARHGLTASATRGTGTVQVQVRSGRSRR
jgi:homoserine O-acetyltransferase